MRISRDRTKSCSRESRKTFGDNKRERLISRFDVCNNIYVKKNAKEREKEKSEKREQSTYAREEREGGGRGRRREESEKDAKRKSARLGEGEDGHTHTHTRERVGRRGRRGGTARRRENGVRGVIGET